MVGGVAAPSGEQKDSLRRRDEDFAAEFFACAAAETEAGRDETPDDVSGVCFL